MSLATPWSCGAKKTSPRIYWHSPIAPFNHESLWRFRRFHARLQASPYHELNPECADFFIIASAVKRGSGVVASTEYVRQMFDNLAQHYPSYQRTAARGLVRYFLLLPCDHGPGDCMYDRKWRSQPGLLPEHLRPDSASRRVGYLMLNGSPQPHTFFRRGIDIRLPQEEDHECGPYCGVPKPQRRVARSGLVSVADNILTHYSPWTKGKAHDALLRAPRPLKFFWSGYSAGNKGFRGGLLKFHANRSGFLLRDTSPSGYARNMHQPAGAPAARLAKARYLAAAMSKADFCYSPLGQRAGDSDRYLPSILYGCIPVFIIEGEVGPLDELIPWEDISVMLKAADLKDVHKILANISYEHIVHMRRAMAGVWERLLWTTSRPAFAKAGVAKRPFLGEDGGRDAFASLVDVLRLRLKRERHVKAM